MIVVLKIFLALKNVSDLLQYYQREYGKRISYKFKLSVLYFHFRVKKSRMI